MAHGPTPTRGNSYDGNARGGRGPNPRRTPNDGRGGGNSGGGNSGGNAGRGPGDRPPRDRPADDRQPDDRQRDDRQQDRGGPADAAPAASVEGVLYQENERQDGQLRDPAHPLRAAKGNFVVPRQLIRELQLRPGLLLRGTPKGRSLSRIDAIENRPTDDYHDTVPLYDSTALDPCPQIKLEHDPAEMTTRIMDILAPVGFGQRGLIVAPPRSGKTILLQNIAKGIAANYPDAVLWLLLVDERPEEVTDMKRNVPGTVFASSNDNTIDKHLDLSQIVIERAKRLVEYGKDVIVLMDSLTRVSRAFNSGGQSGGRTMSGGLDNRALEIPKKLFGAARKVENGGSLTIMATCLVDTGSRMDQIIFEEFKGTGNMELTLDRKLAEQRIYPALDIAASGTRKEEKLLDEKTLAGARNMRRHLMNLPPAQALKNLMGVLAKHPTNEAVYSTIRF
jgi:transcription termination factor Rho